MILDLQNLETAAVESRLPGSTVSATCFNA
jgi:hypothetical protein